MTPRVKAQLEGHTHYQGAPCPRCGNRKRYASNGKCWYCVKERLKRWQEQNRAYYNAYHRDYYKRTIKNQTQ